jgi:nicotinamide mononucleotide transporter
LHTDWVEITGFVTGVANVWLLARQNIWNWPVALTNNALYLAVFLSAGLYGDAGLQVVYAGFGMYGWWSWLRPTEAAKPLGVQRLGQRRAWRLAAATFGAFLILILFLRRFTDSTVPVADGLTTALALAATWGQSRKYLESWWLWIAADVIYIPLYAYKQLWLTAGLYVVFLVLCVAGLRAWRRQWPNAAESPPTRA